MKRYLKFWFALPMVLVVVMLTACQSDDEGDVSTVGKVKVGDVVPDFILTSADGDTVSSSSLAGQVYMLSFFDTGCPDCQQEFPVLQQIYDRYRTSVRVLNVPRSQTSDEVRQYWQQKGLSMPVYTPSDKNLYYQFATSGIPRIYIIDGKGVVRAVLTDSPLASYEAVDAILQTLVSDKNLAVKDSVNLSVRLKVPNVLSGTEADYFRNESTISHLALFFFDSTTGKLYKKAVIKNLTQDEDPIDKQYDITYIIQSLRIQVGVYNIFAVANFEDMPSDIENQDDLLNLTDDITYRTSVEPNIPETGPVMTNRATSMLSVDLIPWANKNYSMTIEMERVMAKMQIGIGKNYFELFHGDRKYADVNITNYMFVNLNRKYYLFQHKDVVTELGKKPDFVLPDNFSDWNGGEEYIVDPLFYDKTTNLTDANRFGNNYAFWYGAYTPDYFASMPKAGSYGYAYILENTSFKTSQKNGYSPGIVFKGAVNPVYVYLYDNKTRTLVKESKAENWPHTFYLYKYDFYGSIQALNAGSGLQFDELVTYTDAQLKAYGIKKCDFNMGVYETYYTYWIQHRQDSQDPMAPMTYGVVRNHYYKICVQGVSGVGDSKITPDIMRDNYPNSYVDVAAE